MLDDMKFFLSLFMRRIHYFLLVFVAVAGVGLTTAYTLPPVYEAEAQLLVESPQIPGNLAASTVEVSAPEILQIIRQRLLTRATLLDISREFNVHADRPGMSPDAIVEDMRKRISMGLPRSRDAAAFVSLSFEASSGALSARVTNELVTRVLEENVSMRKAASGQTLEFFVQEVARLDQELADQGQRILEFKLRNQNALPESVDFRRNRQASLQERILQIERDLSSLRDRRDRLTEMYERTGSITMSEEEMTPEERRLIQLQDDLTTALTVYSEQNPRIQNLQRRVEVLENKVAEQRAAEGQGSEDLSPYEIQIADIEGQMEFLIEQRTTIEEDLAELNASLEATPANAITLGTLERDYENLRVQYNQATADLAAARTGDQIEAQSRGQRITVIEQAVAPREPTAPDRRKIAIMGIGGGIIMGAGLVALLELLNSSIRRPADLTNRLGITPFMTIPYIRTKRQRVARRTLIGLAIALVAIGIPLTLYLLHTYYLPMDLLIERALDKTGLSGVLEQLGLSL
jgi:polysaccharide chain length determinant protein (PEP-CTERM system associated)